MRANACCAIRTPFGESFGAPLAFGGIFFPSDRSDALNKNSETFACLCREMSYGKGWEGKGGRDDENESVEWCRQFKCQGVRRRTCCTNVLWMYTVSVPGDIWISLSKIKRRGWKKKRSLVQFLFSSRAFFLKLSQPLGLHLFRPTQLTRRPVQTRAASSLSCLLVRD